MALFASVPLRNPRWCTTFRVPFGNLTVHLNSNLVPAAVV